MTIQLKPGEVLFNLLKTDQLAFFDQVNQTHGDFVEVRVGARNIHLVHDMDAVKKVFISQAKSFGKAGQLNLLGNLLGQGLLTSDGPLHLVQRRALQPYFHPSVMGSYVQEIQRVSRERIRQWAPGEMIVSDEMNALTLQILGQTMFGAEFSALSESFKNVFDTLMMIYHRGAFSEEELATIQEISPEDKIAEFKIFLDDLIQKLVAERKQHQSSGTDSASTNDFLSLCDSKNMSPEQFRDEMVTLLFAGHETTSVALSWTLWLLAQHSSYRTHLREEIQSVLHGRAVKMEDLRSLPWLMAVLKESMRLYPPVWNITRKVLENIDINGHSLKKDDLVFISPYVLHRDRRHFPDPLTFDPKRWLGEGKEQSPAYMPFGSGGRRCLGESFAYLEAAVILIEIFQNHDLKESDSVKRVRPLGLTTLKPHPHVKLEFS